MSKFLPEFRQRPFNSSLAFMLLALIPLFGWSQRSNSVSPEQLLLDLKTLSADNMEGRAPGTPGSARAREYIVRRFRESGIQPFGNAYVQPLPSGQGSNVVGRIEGTANTGRYIVITAHYDHLGIRNGEIYNGADDNASGVAGMIALAGRFSKQRPRNGIVFAALDAEETGGEGARTFMNNPPVARSAIAMNVNLDMICRAPDDRLFAAGTHHYPFLRPYILQVASGAPVRLLTGHDQPGRRELEDWTEDSDHIWFHRARIPFIYFGVEDYAHHHKPSDEFGNITPEFFVHAVETILSAVDLFDRNLEEISLQAR